MNHTAIQAMYREGDLQTAAYALEEIIASGSADDATYRLLGLVRIKEHKFEAAKRAIEIAIDRNPTKATVKPWLSKELLQQACENQAPFVWAMYHLAHVYYESRSFAAARPILEQILRNPKVVKSILSASAQLLCDVLRRLESKTSAMTMISEVVDKYSTLDGLDIFRGIIAHAEGESARAAPFFSNVAADFASGIHERIVASVGAATFKADVKQVRDYGRSTHDFCLRLETLCATEIHEHDDYVVLCAADDRYFKLFGEVYLCAVLSCCGKVPVHVHLVNPSAESLDKLRRISHDVGWARISSSVSHYAHHQPRPLYAAARFLVAPELIKFYSKPLLITDIDAIFSKNAGPMLKELGTCDVGLNYNCSGRLEFPWTEIFATISYFAPTDQAINFLQLFREYFWHQFLAVGSANAWWIDQNALAFAERRCRQTDIQIFDLGRSRIKQIIDTNLPMENKDIFISRLSKKYNLKSLSQ